jgi:hypothetical protein
LFPNKKHSRITCFFSASQLIREEKKAAIDINKKVIDVRENQNHLISAIKKLKQTQK